MRITFVRIIIEKNLLNPEIESKHTPCFLEIIGLSDILQTYQQSEKWHLFADFFPWRKCICHGVHTDW